MINWIRKNNLKSLPKAIIFDTDNTLYPYEPAHKAAIKAVRNKFVSTFNVQAKEFDQSFHKARLEVKRHLGETAASHSRLLYMQKTLEMLGLGSQVMSALDLEQTYWRSFLANSILFDELVPCLDLVRSYKISTAIVTDLTAQIQFRKMVYFGLDHYFDYIVTSEEAGKDKPNKAPFELAREKLQVTGQHIWMIGDNPKNDIKGARESLGAITIQKIHDGVLLGEGDCKPDAYFTHFSQLTSCLKKLG